VSASSAKSTDCATLLPMTQGETQADPLIGTVVAGKYRVVRQLGEGGMGCVYLAEQQLGSTARKVALKTLHKHLSHDKHIQARFDREAGTVAALEHPNTIQVFDYGTMEDGTLYIVMEYVQGRSVADILEKDGAMPPARVTHILKQVCGSLEEAHGHGIVHRDLKPDNVVLCERAGQKDWVEVLDFGIAKRSSEHDPNEAKLTQQGMVLGTPPYMSPEQFTGQPVDVRSDIYALGVMAYEMLTGKLPWDANTAWEWASKHMTEPPKSIELQPLGPNVPEGMRSAIGRALAKNKDERFPSVTEFFEAFQNGGAAMGAGQTGAMDAAAPAPGRAKTEMAQPAVPALIGAPPAVAPTFASPGGASVPQAPPRAEKKSGGAPGLVIGLGALAVLLLGGGIAAYAFKDKPKAPITTPFDTSSGGVTATEEDAGGSMAHMDEPPPEVPTAEPLAEPLPTPPLGGGGGGGGGGTTKPAGGGAATATPPKPIPKPEPVKPADPEICVRARTAKQKGSPAAVVRSLEAQCRAAGGKP
jgi:eukaryotic-like serine/threonine-protein kinase